VAGELLYALGSILKDASTHVAHHLRVRLELDVVLQVALVPAFEEQPLGLKDKHPWRLRQRRIGSRPAARTARLSAPGGLPSHEGR
jgi:hypothetical protein